MTHLGSAAIDTLETSSRYAASVVARRREIFGSCAIVVFLLTSLSISAKAESLNIYGNDLTLADKVTACGPMLAASLPDGEFCDDLFYLRRNIQPLKDLSSVFGSAQVVFFGEIHTNTSIKDWLAGQMWAFKNLGFTHLAMESLNSEHQPLLEAYKTETDLRPQIVDLFTKEWGWVPDENTDLVDAANAAGVDVVGVDYREELIRAGLGDNIRLRNIHMADQIADLLKRNPAARIAMLTGQIHSRLVSTIEGVKTIPELLGDRGVTSLSFNLESGEEMIANPFAEVYVAEHLSGSFVLQTPPAVTNMNGVIFTRRAVVSGPDIASTDIVNWSQNFSAEAECRFLSDIRGAIVCMMDTFRHSKNLLGRMSYLAESRARKFVPRNDRSFILSKQARYVGHDISRTTFNAFYQAVDASCDRDHNEYCANYFEDELRSFVASEVEARKLDNFAVISVVQSEAADDISHELTHARFFLSSGYQKAVSDLWDRQVEGPDKEAIAKILGETYNITGEAGHLLLINEFQAYLLEDDASTDKLAAFVQKYTPILRKAVEQRL